MSELTLILERPIITEKSVAAVQQNKYTFRVRGAANKIQIRRAIEELFEVHVTQVNTMNYRGKGRRLGRFQAGRTAAWKKAIVTLQAGESIAIYEA